MPRKRRKGGGKRGHGEGSVYPTAEGRWRGYLRVDGKKRYVSALTQAEAMARLGELKGKLARGEPLQAAGSEKLGAYLDGWLATVGLGIRPSTLDSYTQHVRDHIKPLLGHIALTALSTADVQRMISRLAAKELRPRTVHRIHATLRAALNRAKRWRMIQYNPAETALLDLPRAEVYEVQPLSLDEARAFLAAISGHRLEVMYMVLFALGLRQGEALGLRWQDIDLDAGTMTVRWQIQKKARGADVIPIYGSRGLVPTKTHRSRRALHLPASLVDHLARHRERQARERAFAGDDWHEFGLVFTTAKGTPLGAADESRRFQDLLAAAGLDRRRFHDIRHTCGSILSALGVPLSDIQAIMGHAVIQTTMVYVHTAPESQRAAAKKADQAIFGVAAGTMAAEAAAETPEKAPPDEPVTE